MANLCHFSDGCPPSKRGGRRCDCKRLGLSGFTPPEPPPSQWRHFWRDAALVFILTLAVVYGLGALSHFIGGLK